MKTRNSLNIRNKIVALTFFLLQMITASCKEIQTVDTTNLVVFAKGLISPVCISNAGDSRLFVIDQHGLIMIVDSTGNVNPQPFLDITSKVTYGGESGLLGIAFHPQYKTNGYFYVNYTGVGDSTHISRFSVNAFDPNKADSSGEQKLMTIYQPFVNHNGGDLCFGPDGYLYIGLGDGGSAGDPGNRSQNMMEFLGKILRIDVNSGIPYSVPQTNPFYNSTTARKEIWALGLRNPWRFSFDRLTGDLWIGDVGQNAIEEIDYQPSTSKGGENYGWRCYEGNTLYDTTGCNSISNYTFPVTTYPHGPECAVTGGYVDRSSVSSSFYGYYFFADYCSDKIWTLHNVAGNWVVQDFGLFPGNNFSSFGEDAFGRLYVAGITSGKLYRISSNPTSVSQMINQHRVKVIQLNNTGKIRINTRQNSGTQLFLTLYNLSGISCYNTVTRESVFEIDINQLPKGIYFLNIEIDGRKEVYKLTKG